MFGWLRPGELAPLIWSISDPADSTTYYPQIVVKKGVTLETLAVINLTSLDARLYQNTYQVPNDTSGLGFFINVTLKVYTDAGHTTLSPNYEVENDTYLVAERPNRALMGGGGGAMAFGLKDIRKIVTEELKGMGSLTPDGAKTLMQELLQEELGKLPKAEKQTFAELGRIAAIEESLGILGLSHKSSSDLTLSSIKELEGKVPKIDQLESGIESISEAVESLTENYSKVLDTNTQTMEFAKDFAAQVREYMDKAMEAYKGEVEAQLGKLLSNVQVMQISHGMPKLPEPPEEKKPAPKVDYHSIAKTLL